MKQFALGAILLLFVAFVGGCPIYSSSGDYPTCPTNGGCYDCPSGSTPSDGTCVPWQCSSSRDCPEGYACTGGSCAPAPDASDCSGGCPTGYVCKLSGGETQCVPASSLGSETGANGDATTAPESDGAATAADATADVTAADAANVSEASAKADAGKASASDAALEADVLAIADGSDSSASDVVETIEAGDSSTSDAGEASTGADASEEPAQSSCNADGDCGGAGAKCIDGQCTPQSRLCSDTTQCVVSGESCVDGLCMPHCSASAPCPAGYQCDFTTTVCSINPSPCVGSGSSSCLGGSTCVEGRCVPPCDDGDTGELCPQGQICVNGGCIPDEAAVFSCANDGQGGSLATTCSPSEICLHHDCYAGCDPEAGSSACAAPTSCRAVIVTAGTYLVCAGANNLGSDCDPATGKYCTGATCIDGNCE